MEKRRQFTQATVEELSSQGYNAVVVAGRHKAEGYTLKTNKCFEGVDFTILAAERDRVMIVENCGDGGYENWALMGVNWVRWGKIVKFHPGWNEEGMGKAYEVRKRADFPGWRCA